MIAVQMSPINRRPVQLGTDDEFGVVFFVTAYDI